MRAATGRRDPHSRRSARAPGAERIATFRQHGILYDRDGDGEYPQTYTKAFEHRFFFEIVERRHGYNGYGAANAPIRLASQARLTPE